jgi:hypothetical protein
MVPLYKRSRRWRNLFDRINEIFYGFILNILSILKKIRNFHTFKLAPVAADVLLSANFHYQQVSSFWPVQDLISKIGISAACNTPAATLP